MKRSFFIVIVFLVLLIGVCVYVGVSTRDFVDNLPKAPQKSEHTSDNAVLPSPQTGELVPSFDSQQGSDTTEHSALVKDETPSDFDWTDDENPPPNWEQEQNDPFTNYITEQQAKERGTWIGDPDTMDPEELHTAEYNQMLEQFDDIPAVHIAMMYKHRYNNNLPISFEEEVEWQEALVELYPNETNIKTLAYLRWLYPRGSYPEDIGDITPTDIAELRSMGISVKTELTSEGYSVKISTE